MPFRSLTFLSEKGKASHQDVELAEGKSPGHTLESTEDNTSHIPHTTVDPKKKKNLEAPREEDAHAASYHRSSDQLWSLYNIHAKEEDERALGRLKADLDSLLIFAGLFSAAVTAFIIESYKNLNADPQDITVAILAQISLQLAALTNSSFAAAATPAVPAPPFEPTTSSIHTNVLWVLSLILSLTCAMGATLIQMWMARYGFILQRLSSKISHHAGPRTHHNEGPMRIAMWTSFLYTLLHISLYLFLAGLMTFFEPFNSLISHMVKGILIAWATLYGMFSLAPFVYRNSPYITPLTTILQFIGAFLYIILGCLAIIVVLPFGLLAALITKSYATFERWSSVSFSLLVDAKRLAIAIPDVKAVPRPSPEQDQEALEWLLQQSGSDDDFIQLVDGLNSYLTFPRFEKVSTAKIVLGLGDRFAGPGLGDRIGSILHECADVESLSESDRLHRTDACMLTLRRVFLQSTTVERLSDMEWMLWCTRDVLESILALQNDSNPTIALRAQCTATVLLHQALADCGDLIEYSNAKELHVEPHWSLRQMVQHLQGRFWVGYMHQLSIVPLLLPDLGITPEIPHSDDAFSLFVTGTVWGDNESQTEQVTDEVTNTKRRLVDEGSLYVLNAFLSSLLSRAIGAADVDLLSDTMQVATNNFSLEGTNRGTQQVFVDLLGRILSENLVSDHQDFQVESIRAALLPGSVVERLLPIAEKINDPDCASRAQDLVGAYRRRRGRATFDVER
ncbi:unnamed protein product [Somion occarium]|uniref:DUF6535 domain-containing protein n=1 Tax=Somion occarium TaxID=3059160 RepID=A0ABP1DHN5_9APHY